MSGTGLTFRATRQLGVGRVGPPVLTAVLVGTSSDDARVVVEATRAAAWLPMESGAVSVLAVGPDRPSVLDLVCRVAPELGLHHNGKTIRP